MKCELRKTVCQIYKSRDIKDEKERYDRVEDFLNKCDTNELIFLEIICNQDKEATERLESFNSIIPIFISVLSLIITAYGNFFSVKSPQLLHSLITIVIFCIIAILVYSSLANGTSKDINKYTFILRMIKYVKDKRPTKY